MKNTREIYNNWEATYIASVLISKGITSEEHETSHEAEANAYLIAAAPDLLEQLEALVFELSACEEAGNWQIETVQRVIKKRVKSAQALIEKMAK